MAKQARDILAQGEDRDPLLLAARWQDAGHGVALATVVQTWGSAPRQAGSQLVIRDDGLFEGSVSGGCIEGDVVVAAEQTIATGVPQLLEYGVSNTRAWEVGLACGGRIKVFVERLDP